MRAVSLPPDRPNVSSKHSSIMRNCSGSLGSGRQDYCASAVWTKAEAAIRTAQTVAILRPTGRIGCSSCATVAVSWLDSPSWFHSSGTRNGAARAPATSPKASCSSMSTSPWLLGSVCVWGGKVCDANHRARDFGWWALALRPSWRRRVCELVLVYVKGSLMSGESARTHYLRYPPFARTSAQFGMCWAPMTCRMSSDCWRPSS